MYVELDAAIEQLCEKAEAAERGQQMISQGKKANAQKEKEEKQAEGMRAKALERVGETKKKRVVSADVSEEPEKKEKGTRRSGIPYLLA